RGPEGADDRRSGAGDLVRRGSIGGARGPGVVSTPAPARAPLRSWLPARPALRRDRRRSALLHALRDPGQRRALESPVHRALERSHRLDPPLAFSVPRAGWLGLP